MKMCYDVAVYAVTLHTEWELCSPMSVELRQLHLCINCVLSGSDSCGVIQLSISLVLSKALCQAEASKP